MPSKTVVSRTYPRTLYAAFSKNGEPLNLKDVLNGIRKDAELVAHYALQELTEQNLALVTYFDRLKPAEAGRQMNLKLPSEVKKRFRSGSSRLERMFREQVVVNLRSWATRAGVVNQTHTNYVSAGWKRTVSNQKPSSLQPRLSLSTADRQYREMTVKSDRIELMMVVQGREDSTAFSDPASIAESGL